MNALCHGLRSQKAVLPCENQEDFNQLHAGLQDLYQPQTVAEQDLVEEVSPPKGEILRRQVVWVNKTSGINKVLFRSENGVGVDEWSDPNYVFPSSVEIRPEDR